METQDQKILYSLADTMEKTRAELDALRTVSIGIINALAADPKILPVLVAAIQGCIEADTASTLASPMNDDMLQKRSDWITRLLPPQLSALVKLP